jgi:mono/diheme cytochrome c family protein
VTRVSSYVGATIPALVVLGFFVWFANWIPQTRWEPPEKQEISAGMTPVQLAKIGRTIVRQRGCLACHTIEPAAGVKGEGRGPNLAHIAARRARGVPGGDDTLVGYLAQALYDPGAFLVEGYGNIMPVSTRPPAKLSYEEVVAVIDYLQSLGGTPSVEVGDVPRPPREAAGGVTTARAAAPSEMSITDPLVMLTAFECVTCHSLKPGEVLVGPPFEAALLRQAAAESEMSAEAYVMKSIVNPRAIERGDFPKEIMPEDYGERLTAGQLQAMVTYLLARERRK